MKENKHTISVADAPFYYVQGKGWFIDQKYTHPDLGFIHVHRQWFRTKGDAKAAYDIVLAAAIARKDKTLSALHDNSGMPWSFFRADFAEDRQTQIRGSTWHSKDRPMFRKYFDPLFDGLTAGECFSEVMAKKVRNAILNAKTQWNEDVTMTDKNRAVAMYLLMLDFAFERDYMTDVTQYRHCKAIVKKFHNLDESGTGHKRPSIALNLAEVDKLLSVIEKSKGALEKDAAATGNLRTYREAGFADRDWMVTKLMFVAGLRIGEILALFPENVDFDGSAISVENIVAPDKDGTLRRWKRTKTAKGTRTIPITQTVANDLRSFIQRNGIKPDEFIFGGEDPGKPMDRSMYGRRLKSYCREAGIPIVTPHAARHTFSTVGHELGYPAEVIAMILGHNVSVDINIYNHVGNIEKAKKMINDIWDRRTPKA